MDQLKVLALNLCIVVLMFGIVRAILPVKKYENYIRFILNGIVVLLLFNGLKSITFSEELLIPEVRKEANITTEERLEMALKTYINQQLLEHNLSGQCSDASVYATQNGYEIESITIQSKGEETEKIIKLIQEITAMKEDKIYVSDG